MLEIKNLEASVKNTPILNGLNLNIKAGEVHAIMGPNGSGKSTFAKVLAGDPSYEVTSGDVTFDINLNQTNLLDLEPYERARNGIFLGMQYPIEIPGVANSVFLRESFNEICKSQGAETLDPFDFEELLRAKGKLLDMEEHFIHRGVNEGFSGGEKKKNEILQLLLLNPRLAVLDETDSGLDIDALKIVAKGVNSYRNKFNATLLITHYQRLLDYIVPDFVHVLAKGKIIASGGPELAKKLEDKGYDWLLEETC